MAVEFSAWDEPVDADRHVVAIRGEIDLFTAPEFKDLITGAIEAGRKLVVVDLSGATFIDSSSLGVLISAHKRLQMHGGRLVVATDVRAVLNTFAVTGLDSVLDVVSSRDEALTLEPADADADAA